MPRKPSPERQAEYEELKLFLLTLTEFLDQSRSGFQMLPYLKQSLESGEHGSLSMNLRGTRIAVNDVLEETIDFSKDRLRQADEFLSTRRCRTLSSMREQVWQKVPKILRRGRIRNDEEYYLIVERLNDVSETGFQGADRELASRMVSAYEDMRPPD